jgi:hypothetical protein
MTARSIDLHYRPSSYFWARERGIPLISDIKGAERRKRYELVLTDGQTDEVEPALTQHALPLAQRQAQGSIHPAFMRHHPAGVGSGAPERARLC